MQEPEVEASSDAGRERKEAAASRRRLRIAFGCLFVLTTVCVGVCGVAGYGFQRHTADVRRFEAAPMPSVTAETDPGFRLLAEARASVGAEAISSCADLENAIAGKIDELSDAEAFALHEWTRARLAELDTQSMREACQTVGYGVCSDESFLAFRAYLLAMGRPTFALAIADDDAALARILPKTPYCRSLVDVTYAGAVRTTVIEDAGVDAGPTDAAVDASMDGGPSDGRIPVDAGLPLAERIGTETSTRSLPRRELGAAHPHLCHRFTCTVDDVFD